MMRSEIRIDRLPQALSRVDLPRYLVLYGAPGIGTAKPAKRGETVASGFPDDDVYLPLRYH